MTSEAVLNVAERPLLEVELFPFIIDQGEPFIPRLSLEPHRVAPGKRGWNQRVDVEIYLAGLHGDRNDLGG